MTSFKLKKETLYLNGKSKLINWSNNEGAMNPSPDVVINVECHSDVEVLSVLVQRVKRLNIDKKDHRFKIHIVVMTKMML